MNIPDKVELQHMQLQAILRDNHIPNSELMYLGEREYSGCALYSSEYSLLQA